LAVTDNAPRARRLRQHGVRRYSSQVSHSFDKRQGTLLSSDRNALGRAPPTLARKAFALHGLPPTRIFPCRTDAPALPSRTPALPPLRRRAVSRASRRPTHAARSARRDATNASVSSHAS